MLTHVEMFMASLEFKIDLNWGRLYFMVSL